MNPVLVSQQQGISIKAIRKPGSQLNEFGEQLTFASMLPRLSQLATAAVVEAELPLGLQLVLSSVKKASRCQTP